MRYRTIILLTDPSGKPVGLIEKELAPGEYPSQTALALAHQEEHSSLLITGNLRYLGCEQSIKNTIDYVFHLYSGKKSSLFLAYEEYLFDKYAQKISSFDFMEDFTLNFPDKVCLDDLIKITQMKISPQPDWNLLKNGSGFLNLEAPLPTGCINFPEAARFMGMNIFKQGVSRGNHYHLHKVEYTYVLQGEIKAYLRLIDNSSDEKEIHLHAGDLVLFLPGSYHSLTAVSETAYVIEVSPLAFEPEDYYRT